MRSHIAFINRLFIVREGGDATRHKNIKPEYLHVTIKGVE